MDIRTGDTRIKPQRLRGFSGNIYASPVAAAGRFYFTDRNGATSVLKHDAELTQLALNELNESIDASPAVVGSQLFLRGKKHLYCIEEL